MPQRTRTIVPVITAVVTAVAACATPEAQDAAAPDTAARALLDRSIAFHDPDGQWGRDTLRLDWAGTDADSTERVAVSLTLDPTGRTFALAGRYRGSDFRYRTDGDRWSATVDGDANPSAEARSRMRLDREDGLFWRSYYGFLAGLPMKLNDAGTIIEPDTTRVTFAGREALAIRVRYDPRVGTDTWYFYFDPATAALVGARFYHDEAANDGEYLEFEGLAISERLRLPRHRRWYVNADGRFLGADDIRAISVHPGA